MGNVPVSITIETSSTHSQKIFSTMEQAFNEARRIEKDVSEWQPSSQTSLLNQNAGKFWVPIGKDLMQILLTAYEVSEKTDGAFDITFSSKNKTATYQDVLALPGLSLAFLKKKNMQIGVSGIAKGYIVDRMSDVLRKNGFRKFLVNAGDLYAEGSWSVGIRIPKSEASEVLCTLPVHNQAVSTSGLYERGNHIIDPHTRKPATEFQSVTVVAPTSIVADALAKGVFVGGSWSVSSRAKRGDLTTSGGLPRPFGARNDKLGFITLNSQGFLKVSGNVSGTSRCRNN